MLYPHSTQMIETLHSAAKLIIIMFRTLLALTMPP